MAADHPDLADDARRGRRAGGALLIGAFYLGYSLVKIPPANALATKQSNVYLYPRTAPNSPATARSTARTSASTRSPPTPSTPYWPPRTGTSTPSPPSTRKAMVRAGWNTATGKGTQSGSTITQQYVKNYYLGQEQTVTRKVKEFFISIKLDREESKS
ncbi:transglycosylase domain-containing protein [Streptomyces sp. L7]